MYLCNHLFLKGELTLYHKCFASANNVPWNSSFTCEKQHPPPPGARMASVVINANLSLGVHGEGGALCGRAHSHVCLSGILVSQSLAMLVMVQLNTTNTSPLLEMGVFCTVQKCLKRALYFHRKPCPWALF